MQEFLSTTAIANSITALKWLFGLAVVGKINTFLSVLGQNNFRLRSEKSRYDWPNEIAVITGAAGGFGRLFSKDLAAQGITVIGLDIADQLPWEAGPKIHYYKCDITNQDAVHDIAARIKREHGNPSILINNAGVAFNHSIIEAKAASLRKIFDVNLISHYFTTQAFLPAMIEQDKGHIVTIASMASFVSPPAMLSYANTKVAALSFHEGLQGELRMLYDAPSVKCTVVHPTFAATPMTAPHSKAIQGNGFKLIDPQVVADRVVGQILSCKGAQLMIGEGSTVLSTMRAWPHWASALILRLGGKGADPRALGESGKQTSST